MTNPGAQLDQSLLFGWRTAILAVAFAQLLLLAAALVQPVRNRVANRTLAALLLVLAGMITPWMIGFAGFYDRWPWLSFAPFAVPLAIAPLAYLYGWAMIHGAWPERAWRHLLAPGIQFLYLAAAFLLLRQPFKNDWLARSSPVYELVVGLGVAASLAGYGLAGRRLLRRYRAALSRQVSDERRFALVWLGRIGAALFALLAVWTAYTLWSLADPLGYRGLMGLYIAMGLLGLFLGIEGWRHADLTFPAMAAPEAPASPADWSGRAAPWIERVRRDRLYADPDLNVPRLARILGTNTAYVSRAFNAGLGESFSAHINRLRCEEVASRLRDGDPADLLDLALDAGFSAKASFNRAFRAVYGCTPSAYRRLASQNAKIAAIS
jgi:AraC-like DNA-binding protein